MRHRLLFLLFVGSTALHCDDPARGTLASASVPSASAPPAASALTQAAIDEVVAAHRAELAAACASDVRRATLREIQLMFEIDAQGGVVDAAAAGGGSAERPLRKCVEQHLRDWKFPPPDVAPKNISAMISFAE